MPVEKISRYKKSISLGFCDATMEQDFQTIQRTRGRSTAIYSLIALAVINFIFAFLEFWILGINSQIPLFGFIAIAVISLLIALFSVLSSEKRGLKARILIPGILTLCVLLGAVYLQHYRLYHVVEITLLVIWVGCLNVFSFKQSLLLSFMTASVFIAAGYFAGATETKFIALIFMMMAAISLAVYLSYLLERLRRMIFLTYDSLKNVYMKQENWAYTLIDLDMSLSGIMDLKELIGRLMEHIKTVIDYDSYVMTTLDGKGPKPEADEIQGKLFEEDDNTLWPDDLLMRLSQTRQAEVSAEFTESKGLFGKKKQHFENFRMDVPVFNESNIVAVISLKRETMAFDDFDMTASVSIATQAMMIFNRTLKNSLMSAGLQQAVIAKTTPPIVEPPEQPVQEIPVTENPAQDSRNDESGMEDKLESSPSTDIDLTTDQTSANKTTTSQITESDETVVPSEVLKQIRKKTETARKTITLLSRENAEHISMDRYRTAAVEGEALSLLLVEVDGLSAVREKEGDQTAYRIFAGIVKYVFSKTDKEKDVLGRYGQNGFSILLPRVDMNAAEKFAESLREYTENTSFKTALGDRRATLSIGVASITDETGNHESMVKRADMALFVAKKNGRNCVKVRL